MTTVVIILLTCILLLSFYAWRQRQFAKSVKMAADLRRAAIWAEYAECVRELGHKISDGEKPAEIRKYYKCLSEGLRYNRFLDLIEKADALMQAYLIKSV